MSPRYLRRRPTREEEWASALTAAAFAVGVGLAGFYLLRLLVAREPVERSAAPARLEAGTGE